jgi:hypothetical protein
MTDAKNIHESLPMFYRSPRPLERERDANLCISRPHDFSFAATTNAIPILTEEMPVAAAHYPIIFTHGPQPFPAAVVGFYQNQNLFVDQNGQWLGGAYLPSYVRRYPFILMDDPEQKQFVLCIDEESDQLGVEGEVQLFENGEPSKFTLGAMEFCAALRQQGDATDEFVRALQKHEILAPNSAAIEIHDKKLQLSGFLVIDPKKFDALPDSVILEWRAHGWLRLVYAHLLSSHRWPSLYALLDGREDAGPISAFQPSEGQISSTTPSATEEFRLSRRPNKGGLFD